MVDIFIRPPLKTYNNIYLVGFQVVPRISAIQPFSVGRYGDHLPRDEFAAVFEGCDSGMLNAAAARNLHPYNRDALYIIIPYYFGQLFAVITSVELWASNKCYAVFYKLAVKIAVCISGAVSLNKQMRSVKIRCSCRDKLYLNRPLIKLRRDSCITAALCSFCRAVYCLCH